MKGFTLLGAVEGIVIFSLLLAGVTLLLFLEFRSIQFIFPLSFQSLSLLSSCISSLFFKRLQLHDIVLVWFQQIVHL